MMIRLSKTLVSMVALVAASAAAAGTLTQGVAAGDVTSNSAILWGAANSAGSFTFDLSAVSDFSAILDSKVVGAGSVPVEQAFSGLAANTRYFYRGTDAGGNIATGTFVTAATSGFNGLKFGVSGDARGELAPFPAIANAAGEALDFFVHLGDTIYADYPSPALPLAQATTLADYYAKHAEQLTPRDGLNTWVDLRQSTALVSMIDDHEVINDFAGGAPISSDPRFAGTGAPSDLINTSTLYQNGLQAFQDYMPGEARTWAGTGDATLDGRPDLYRAQRYGKDALFIVADARSFRDPELDDSNPAVLLATAFTPGRTMLGDPQFERLKADLLTAKADGVTWKFVSIPEPIQNLGPLAAADRYEGYAAERTALLKFIADNDIQNVVFIAADIHGTSINNLTYQNGSPFDVQHNVAAWEITTGAVAFDAPFGPTIAQLALGAGLMTPAQYAFYQSLPIAPDLDDIPNDKDDFIRTLLNQFLTTTPSPFNGYSALGLQDSGLDYQLLAGDWFLGHYYGWTEFEIDAATQDLTVSTFGIAYDQVNDALGNPLALAALQPSLVGRFTVKATGAVPEPASWALMIGGMGLVGAAMRRRVQVRFAAV
jgi:alkaline phosphatase D